MIYLDTSVALAHLLGEDLAPPTSLWDELLVSSRLLEYEMFTRLHARGLTRSHTAPARALLDRVALADMSVAVLGRALEPFPVALRTLDAMHLATILFLQAQGQAVRLATYDSRMGAVAQRLGIRLVDL